MKAFTTIFEGKEDGVPCDSDVRIKVWKQGHSIKCPKFTDIRWWQPKPDIFAELKDHCRGCNLFDSGINLLLLRKNACVVGDNKP